MGGTGPGLAVIVEVMAIKLDRVDAVGEHGGVLTSAQAFALFGRSRVRAEVQARRWNNPAHGLIVLHNGSLSDPQRHRVALAASAPESVLGGLSALVEDGFAGFAPGVPTVVQPMGSRRPSYTDVQARWSTYLGAEDVHPLRCPRRVRPTRAVVDAASWHDNERYARAIVLAAVQQRIVATRQLREALTRRVRCRHRALIVESVLDAHGGIQSLPERDFDTIRAAAGLPRPRRQRVITRADGRCYLDVAWDDFDAACEIHGIPDTLVPQWDGDLMRTNEITLAGPRLLSFSSYTRRQHETVTHQLRRLLKRGGWRAR